LRILAAERVPALSARPAQAHTPKIEALKRASQTNMMQRSSVALYEGPVAPDRGLPLNLDMGINEAASPSWMWFAFARAFLIGSVAAPFFVERPSPFGSGC
jgi:hypothetical protein